MHRGHELYGQSRRVIDLECHLPTYMDIQVGKSGFKARIAIGAWETCYHLKGVRQSIPKIEIPLDLVFLPPSPLVTDDPGGQAVVLEIDAQLDFEAFLKFDGEFCGDEMVEIGDIIFERWMLSPIRESSFIVVS